MIRKIIIILLITILAFLYFLSRVVKTSIPCGGLGNIQCPKGYLCFMKNSNQNTLGNCVKDISNFKFP